MPLALSGSGTQLLASPASPSRNSRSPIQSPAPPPMAGRCEGEHPASPWRSGAPGEEGYSGSSPSAIILVGLIGATATAAAVGQLRRTVRWFYTQLRRSEPYVYWEDIPQTRRTYRHGEAWEQFYQRMRKMNEDQREREERIRRMQDVFKKERSKCRDYRTWESYNPYYQHDRRYDRYWDAESFYANQRTNFRLTPKETMSYAMSRHYSILGLDRSRSEPFSDA